MHKQDQIERDYISKINNTITPTVIAAITDEACLLRTITPTTAMPIVTPNISQAFNTKSKIVVLLVDAKYAPIPTRTIVIILGLN